MTVVSVWWAGPADARPWHDAVLGDADLARRARLRRPTDRNRFTAAYALTRLVLGDALGAPPASLVFDRTCVHCGGPHGKPRLASDGARFSLSHSGERVVVAVTTGLDVGVDVERVEMDLSVRELAGQVLAAGESARSVRELLTYWTRKEAVLKATGHGLAVPLRDLHVSAPDEPPRLHRWAGGDFRLHDLDAGDGYVAALAVPAGEVREFDGRAVLAGAPRSDTP